MNPSTIPPAHETPVDPDLAEQAVPGHGIPSQDPSPAAQVALSPEESERESKSVMMGGGVIAAAATGAAVGAAVSGPIGVMVGGIAGAVAGALGGGAAGMMASDSPSSTDDEPKDVAGVKRGVPLP